MMRNPQRGVEETAVELDSSLDWIDDPLYVDGANYHRLETEREQRPSEQGPIGPSPSDAETEVILCKMLAAMWSVLGLALLIMIAGFIQEYR